LEKRRVARGRTRSNRRSKDFGIVLPLLSHGVLMTSGEQTDLLVENHPLIVEHDQHDRIRQPDYRSVRRL
jgi:hypothetical protein